MGGGRCGGGCDGSQVFLGVVVAFAVVGGFLFGYDTGVVSGASLLLRQPGARGGTFPFLEGGGDTPKSKKSAEDPASALLHDNLEEEAFVSVALAGAMAGSLVGGAVSDAAGRRRAITTASVAFILGSLLLAVAGTLWLLLVGRAIVGLGIGMAANVVPVYVAEIAPAAHRGALVTANNLALTGGQLAAFLVDAVFASVPHGWRYMLGLASLPAAILFVGVVLVLPESPRWLVRAGRDGDALDVLRRVRPRTAAPPPVGQEDDGDGQQDGDRDDDDDDDDHDLAADQSGSVGTASIQRRRGVADDDDGSEEGSSLASEAHQDVDARSPLLLLGGGAAAAAPAHLATELRGIQRAVAAEEAQRRRRQSSSTLMALLAPRARAMLLLGCGLQLCQQFAGINTVMYYSPTILVMAGFKARAAIWASVAIALSNAVFTGVGLALIDRVGRRPLLLGTMPGFVVALGVLGLCFFLDEHPGALSWWNPHWTGPVAVCSLVAYTMFFAVGLGPVPWLVCAEIFPQDIRGKAVGITTFVNWTANLVVSATFLSYVDLVGRAWAFWTFGAIAVLFEVAFFIAMPETRGLSIEDAARATAPKAATKPSTTRR